LAPIDTEVVAPPSAPPLTVARPPEVVLAEAQQAAKALAGVIAAKPRRVTFGGENYLEFEDWTLVARFYGVTAKVESTAYIQYDEARGFEARASAILNPGGQIISAAEAVCLDDEPNWSRKPLFQLRSMAQTRACAKALRNALSWVVVLAGYRPTPAEEMDGVMSKPPIRQPERQSARRGDTNAMGEPIYRAQPGEREILEQHGHRTADPDVTEPPPPTPSSSTSTISEKQRSMLWAKAKAAGWSEDELRELVKRHGFEHSKDISKSAFDGILTDLARRGEF
jgi:hypothetical protein